MRVTLALVAVGLIAQAVPNDPTSNFLSLGVAGLLATMAMLWQRDTAKQRDRALDTLAQTQPLLEQIKEALVQSTEAHRAGIEASREASRAIHDLPSRETWFKVIAALERLER